MKEQTGETYTSSQYAKFLMVANSKDGKTVWSAASALGALPWQKEGGLVSDPRHFHVVAADVDAVSGVKSFLQKCGAPAEAMKFTVWNFQDDVRRVVEGKAGGYDHTFFLNLMEVRDKIQERSAGKGAVVLLSSLTGIAHAIERSLMGQPKGKSDAGKGYGDRDRWTLLSAQLFELQDAFHTDDWHCLWEGHLMPKGGGGGGQDGAPKPDSIAVRGSAGQNWGYNTNANIRIRRHLGQKHPGTQIDQVSIETRPSLDFVSNGRNFAELLAEKEVDLTVVCRKLGFKVGSWGAKSSRPSAPPKK